MKSSDSLEALLEKKIGLAIGSVGRDFFQRMISRRMDRCGISSENEYLALLESSLTEMNELIEKLTIPETWFYRNRKQLDFFAEHVKATWSAKRGPRGLRILSMPCATGEEPCTIAMILSDLGLKHGRFHIDAVDISARALEKARMGLYGETSFRGSDLSFRDRYFEKTTQGYRVRNEIRERIKFFRGNVVDKDFLKGEKPYDFIFCRNLFIYLNPVSKKKAARVFQRILNPDGILFMGHTEECPFEDETISRVRKPGVFCYRHTCALSGPPEPVTPRQREIREAPERQTIPPAPVLFPVKAASSPVVPRAHEIRTDPVRQEKTGLDEMFEQARTMADQGKLDRALPLCEEILSKDSGFTKAYFLKGVIYSARDDANSAEECFKRVLYLEPDHIEALRHLVILAEHDGDFKKASMLLGRMKRIRDKMGAR